MKKTLSVLLCVAMLFSIVCVNGTALEAKSNSVEFREVPEGFCESEYLQLVEFFATADENGITNGEKLNPDFDPNDPNTWMNVENYCNVYWTQYDGDGLNHFSAVSLSGLDLVGDLNLNNFPLMQTIDAADNRLSAVHTENDTNCTRLNISGNDGIYFDLTNTPHLINLSVMRCGISELDAYLCPDLVYLYCTGNNLHELNVTFHSDLWFLYCEDNMIAELDLSNNRNLGMLCFDNNQISELDLSSCSELFGIFGANNSLTDITLPSYASSLGSVDLSHNNLTEFTCMNAPFVYELYLNDNRIEALTIADDLDLYALDIRNNQLTEMNVSTYPNLDRFLFSGNPIDSMDLSNNNHLFLLDSTYMEGMELTTSGNSFEDGLTNFPFEAHVFAENGGLVRLNLAADQDLDSVFWPYPYIKGRAIISARANEGYAFVGWFDGTGSLVSSDEELTYTDANLVLNLTAKFEAQSVSLPGDVNGDGIIDQADALLILRYALNIIDETLLNAQLADYNGDGIIDQADALLVLRTALNIE